jgi:hypothetical protein
VQVEKPVGQMSIVVNYKALICVDLRVNNGGWS